MKYAFYVTVFNIICCFCCSWKRVAYYLLETLVILFCSCCLLVLSALWYHLLIKVHFILVFSSVLPVFTRCWYTVIFITCAPFACFVLVPCYILLSFDFVYYSRPTSSWFTLPFSFTLVYSSPPSVPVLRSLMCFVSLSVGSTINYYYHAKDKLQFLQLGKAKGWAKYVY